MSIFIRPSTIVARSMATRLTSVHSPLTQICLSNPSTSSATYCSQSSPSTCHAAPTSHSTAPLTSTPASSSLPTPGRSFSTQAKAPKKPTKLTGKDLDRAIGTLTGWTLGEKEKKEVIVKSFVFDDFNTCFSVMTRTALLAEKLNHHPKWTNVYNQLKVELETHDVNGVSDMDIYMAQQIDFYVSQTKKPVLPK